MSLSLGRLQVGGEGGGQCGSSPQLPTTPSCQRAEQTSLRSYPRGPGQLFPTLTLRFHFCEMRDDVTS